VFNVRGCWLLDADSAGPDDSVKVASGIVLTYVDADQTKALDLPWTYHFVIELAGGITSSAAIGRGFIRNSGRSVRRSGLSRSPGLNANSTKITQIIDRTITVERQD
jgi:hypothetical protein